MKKIIIIVFVLLFVAACTDEELAPVTQPNDLLQTLEETEQEEVETKAEEVVEVEIMQMYMSIRGEITSIEDDSFILETENGLVRFLTDNAFTLNLKETGIQTGDTIIGFYEPSVFMAQIEPPQYNPVVIVVGEFANIHLDRFDESLTSYDGSLTIQIGENTEIIYQDGEIYGGASAGLHFQRLLVIYGMSTRSIPAITTPDMVVILSETDLNFDGGVIVNGEPVLQAFHMGLGDDGFPTHVTLMAVLAVLEAPVNVSNGVVTVEGRNGTIVFEIDSYDFDVNGEIITLPFAAFQIDGTIYVPIRFFKDVFGMNNAYAMHNTVFIDDGEVME